MKILKRLMIFLMLIVVFIGVKSVNAGAPEIELSSYSRIWMGDSIPLNVTNNTGDTITISGPIEVNIGGSWNQLDIYFGDTYKYDFIAGLEIAAGNSAVIGTVAPGNPMSWRGPIYHSPQRFKARFTVNDVMTETNEITVTPIYEDITYDDEEIDYVYFTGEQVNITITDLPTDFLEDGISNVVGDNYDTARIYFLLCSEPFQCEYVDVFEGLAEDDGKYYFEYTDYNGTINIEGIVKDGIEMGFLGYHIVINDTDEILDNDEIIIGADGSRLFVVDHLTNKSVMLAPGTPIVAGIVMPDFTEINNLYETEKEITFTKAGTGSITFASGLNIMDNAEQLAALETGFNLSFDNKTKTLRAKVDTSTLTFLSGHSATITFLNAMANLGLEGVTATNFLDFINISVMDNNELVSDISGYLDLTQATYNPLTDILTIPVNHFTEYIIGLAEVEEEIVPIPQTGTRNNSWLLLTTTIVSSFLLIRKRKLLKSY